MLNKRVVLAGVVLGFGSASMAAAPVAAVKAGEAAAGALAGELIAMAKGSKFAGIAKGRANDQPDTDDDTIGWLLYHTIGPEFLIDLDIDISDQKAKAFADIDYEVPIKGTWDSWLIGGKGKFTSTEAYAQVDPPGPGDKNPQYAFVEWAIAQDGQVVFGPYRADAGRDPFAGGGAGGTNVVPFVPSERVSLRRVDEMPAIAGSFSLSATLQIIDRSGGQAVVTQALLEPGFASPHLSAGFDEDVTPDVEPLPGNPTDFADLDVPASYDMLYDIRFTQLASSAIVPLTDGFGDPYTDEEILLLAAEQLFGFTTGNASGSATLTDSVGTVIDGQGDVTIDADFSVPFGLPSWESDRTFYSPDWDYWYPLIEAGDATIEEAWSEVLDELTALGVDVEHANFRSAVGHDYESAQAVPEPAMAMLASLALLSLSRCRRRC